MLVIVKDGDAEVLQGGFDFKTSRGGNVFEVNAAKNGGNPPDGFDDFLGILGG